MQSETGFPSSHQLKSYVASKSRLKLASRAVLSADAGLLVGVYYKSQKNIAQHHKSCKCLQCIHTIHTLLLQSQNIDSSYISL